MTTALTITPQDIQQEVRKIAAEFPNVVYNGERNEGALPVCHYTPDERNPHGCIIGFALRRLGIEIDKEWDTENLGVIPVLERLHIGFEDDAEVQWLREVQDHQDAGTSWGEAVVNVPLP